MFNIQFENIFFFAFFIINFNCFNKIIIIIFYFYHFSNNLPSVLLNTDLSLICKEKQLINLVVLRTKIVF